MDKQISLEHLRHNLWQIQNFLDDHVSLLAVIKANAYGHHVDWVAPYLERLGVRFFGVANIQEALHLRQLGICSEILILSALLPQKAELLFDHNLVATISSLDIARYIVHMAEKKKQRLCVHLKVDTGMSRCGALPQDILPIVQILNASGYIDIEGIYSHLATADSADLSYADQQEQVFCEVIQWCHDKGMTFKHIHLANSASVLKRSQKNYTLVRIGCLLYGALPNTSIACPLDLKPVMSLHAQVVQVKHLPAGVGVGYGMHYITDKETPVAVINMGYSHGVDQRMSAGGKVLINGQKRPIIGTVSMDLTIVELEPQDNVVIGDEVVVMGQQLGQMVDVHEIAQVMNTVPYEVLCRVGEATPLAPRNAPRHTREEEIKL